MNKRPLLALDIMLLMLAGVAGSIDAIGYLALGHVLTANMTGNTVLLGVAAGKGQLLSVLRALAALGGFVAGVTGGALLINQGKERLKVVNRSIRTEIILIGILCILWFFREQSWHTVILFASIIVSAVTMGLQSVTIRYLRIPGVVTTYLTGMITTIITEVTRSIRGDVRGNASPSEERPPLEHRITLQLLVFFTYGGIAAITAFVYLLGWHFLPVIPLLLITGVMIILQKHHSRVFLTLETEKT